ncbi:YncE family protein [Roseimaritima ulvae]|nr:hypothetical protein [Roseimaritima ulvae]
MAVLVANGCSSSKPAPPAKAAAKPELTNVYQVGPVVDLLAMVDPQRDAVTGEFRWQEESLIVPAVRAAQLNLDVDLPEQYELRMEVARVRGNESLNLGITVGAHQAVVVIEGWGKRISGLNLVDGRLGEDNETSSTFPVFTDNAVKSIRVIVRRESVLVDVGGNVFIDYRGAPSRLNFDERFFRRPRLNQLMLGSWQTEFRVTRWTLTPFGDQPVDYTKTPDAVVATTANMETKSEEPPASLATDLENSAEPPVAAEPFAEASSEPTAEMSPAAANEPRAEDDEKPNQVAWQAVPDPYPQWDGSAVTKLSVSQPADWVVVPFGPSPFFMTGTPTGESIRWQVHDIRSGNPIGKACELPASDHHFPRLCPSGRYMLTYVGISAQRRVAVQSFVSGETVYEAASPDVRISDAPRDLLALNHSLVSVRGGRDDVEFQRVDLRTGKVELTWNVDQSPGELAAITVSPGGRYLLVNGRRQLNVYELATGQRVGQVDVPEQLAVADALAFSRDGAELALLGRESGRPSPILWCIDWSGGETVLQEDMQAEIHGMENNYLFGPALEWFPNNELLLYYGRDVIDRQSGKFCVQIPGNQFWEHPRRTLGSRSILGMMPGEDPNQRVYRSVSLSSLSLDTALHVLRRGGSAADVGLPPLSVPNSGEGKRLAWEPSDGPLRVQLAERPALPELKLPMLLASFKESNTELRRIEFADPPAATAVMHFTFNRRDDHKRRDMLVRFDLQRRKPTGSIPIHKDFHLVGVSPDGTRAMIGRFNEVDAYGRLDVVDLVSKQHVAGWLPFADEVYAADVSASGQPQAKNPMTANWVRFVGNDRVVAVNPAGKLVCWQLPECEVLLGCDDFGQPLGLSADRRYLAGEHASRLVLLDLQSGSWAGEVRPAEPPLAILRAGFASDNGQLAAVLGYQGRHQLVVWNLTNGTPLDQFDMPFSTGRPGRSEQQNDLHRQWGLDFRRSGYLTLDDLYLIDRAGESIAWQYSLRRGKHAVNGPDDREWFTEYRTADHGRGQAFEYWLTATELPSQQVVGMIGSAPASDSQRPVGRSVLSTTDEEARLIPPAP